MSNSDATPITTARPSARVAFVVHLLRSEPDTEPVSGRVEHVQTGAAMTFASVEELLRFMRQTLARLAPDVS